METQYTYPSLISLMVYVDVKHHVYLFNTLFFLKLYKCTMVKYQCHLAARYTCIPPTDYHLLAAQQEPNEKYLRVFCTKKVRRMNH